MQARPPLLTTSSIGQQCLLSRRLAGSRTSGRSGRRPGSASCTRRRDPAPQACSPSLEGAPPSTTLAHSRACSSSPRATSHRRPSAGSRAPRRGGSSAACHPAVSCSGQTNSCEYTYTQSTNQYWVVLNGSSDAREVARSTYLSRELVADSRRTNRSEALPVNRARRGTSDPPHLVDKHCCLGAQDVNAHMRLVVRTERTGLRG